MPRTWITLILYGLLLAGCSGEPPAAAPSPAPAPEPAPAPGDHRLTMPDGRTVLVHAPPGYTGAEPVPLVVALHFYPGSGEAMRDMIGMDAKADEHGFLVAYPDGVSGGFNALICCGNQDDVAFIKALTDRLITDWRVDPDRVYATGISNGGDMSFRLAVETTGVFAAIGAVSGGFSGPLTEAADYKPEKPVSVLSIIGDQDRYYDTFRSGLDVWRERLSCESTRCADGSDLEVRVVEGMGHSWPGAKTGQLAAPDAPIVATDLLWDFFSAHPRRG